MFRACLVAAVCAAPASAAGVAVYNYTDRPLAFTLGYPGKPPTPHTLAAGEARLLPVGRQPDIGFQSAGKPVRFRLEPFHAYMFSADKTGVEFHGIDFAAAMPRPDDVHADPPAASAVLEKSCGVRLEVVSVGDWRSDASTAELPRQAQVFEKAVTLPAGVLAVGFTSRFPKGEKLADLPTGFAREPLWPYLLVRDGNLFTEPERVDAVVRELGHYLGAAHVKDPLSAMRAKQADGRGYVGRYPVGLDPLNLLAVGVWADELRAGKPKSFADLKPASRERLAVIYKTLSGGLPDDPLAADHLAALERVGDAAPAAVKDPPPMPKVELPPAAMKVEPKLAEVPKPVAVAPKVEPPAAKEPPPAVTRSEAVRQVVQAVRFRAIDLKRDPDADKAKGDALTVELLMAAADIAYRLEGPVRVSAFLLGIGIALDDSEVLRGNPLFAGLCKAAETDAERAERVAALGTPTLRGRRDLCQHFVVSAALTANNGATFAEGAGLLKELADRDGTSGFSFADLAADYAGIQLALALAKYPEAVGRFRDGVNLGDYMPDIKGLRESLPAAKFKELYGGTDDQRFKDELARVRKRVTDLPKYKEIADLK